MPMTRAEKAAMEALQQERDMYRAMVISPPVKPTIEPFKGGYGENDFNRGWLPVGSLEYMRVEKAAVSATYHRHGDDAWATDGRRKWSQNTKLLYATKADAWRQARHEMSVKCAQMLARIDREIAKCEAEGQ